MEGHIIAATLKHFEMENQESDIPVPGAAVENQRFTCVSLTC